MEQPSYPLIKVRTDGNTGKIAGSIAKALRRDAIVDVQAIGAGAVNQAMKAIAVARRYLNDNNLDAVVLPTFVEIVIDGKTRTALRLRVETRALPPPTVVIRGSASTYGFAPDYLAGAYGFEELDDGA